MTTESQKLGKKGEELAKEYYQNNHYTILESNWRSSHLEIDLIVINHEYIVFCEVKTRSSRNFGNPEQFVTLQKQKNLIRAANYYINQKAINKEVRFDIISIIENEKGSFVHHIPGAFTPKW